MSNYPKQSSKKIIANDALRFRKNKTASRLALLALGFNVLYFTLLYGIKEATLNGKPTKFVSMDIGVSVVLTLVFLLTCFLSSEELKSYNKNYSFLLLGLAVFQVARIFYFPLYGLKNNLLLVNYFGLEPTDSLPEFIIMTVYLSASAICLIASAITGYLGAVKLKRHVKAMEGGLVNVEAAMQGELNDANG